MEEEASPVRPPITHQEYRDLHNIIAMITHEMLGDLSSSANIDSVYEPFQPLIRQILTAGVTYFSDHGADGLRAIAQALLDGGKLDGSRVARSPDAAEVRDRLWNEDPGTARSQLSRQPESTIDAIVQRTVSRQVSVIADAMDCAYKQALAAPPTIGSMFQSPAAPPAEIAP